MRPRKKQPSGRKSMLCTLAKMEMSDTSDSDADGGQTNPAPVCKRLIGLFVECRRYAAIGLR